MEGGGTGRRGGAEEDNLHGQVILGSQPPKYLLNSLNLIGNLLSDKNTSIVATVNFGINGS